LPNEPRYYSISCLFLSGLFIYVTRLELRAKEGDKVRCYWELGEHTKTLVRTTLTTKNPKNSNTTLTLPERKKN
jgi:hypothetical protein